jgi:calcineurin-like phosphoesterase family protein
MIHFTADTHFGHGNIIRYCHRPFASMEKMDETMRINWNLRVKPEDTVYVLGDFMFTKQKGGQDVAELLRSLNGKKHLIEGNHDRKAVTGCPEWESVQSHLVKSINNVPVHMYHYPIFSWDRGVHGSWMLHGHCHNGLPQYPQYASVDWDELKIEDVGVDAWGFRPVSFYELKDRMDRKVVRPKSVDWRNASNNIPDAECIDGYLYWISGRNAQVGVYVRESQSFMVPREKFGHVFVDKEYHWDVDPRYGTVKPLQRLERSPFKSDYETADMLAYLQEAEKRYGIERYNELVWSFRRLSEGGGLHAANGFSYCDDVDRYISLVGVDVRNPVVAEACSEWSRVELNVRHAMARYRHGIVPEPSFFLNHQKSFDEFLVRKRMHDERTGRTDASDSQTTEEIL